LINKIFTISDMQYLGITRYTHLRKNRSLTSPNIDQFIKLKLNEGLMYGVNDTINELVFIANTIQ
jgi:hypothetical protein